LNADAIWVDGPRPSLQRLAEHWDPETMDVLLLLAHASSATGWGNKGDFAMDQTGRLRRPEKGEVTPFVYAGAGIWQPELFAGRPEVFSLNRIFDEAIARGRLHGLRLDGIWMHVGTPDAVPEAEAAIRRSIR
jgi:MurNAc alpha-1-phosphate uridylyltransferase